MLSFTAKVVFLKKYKIIKPECMKTELRYAVHPADFKKYDTEKLRKEFLIENIFVQGEISLVYSMYDRYMVGGAMPVNKDLNLETADDLKSAYFLERREMGIINVGGEAEIEADLPQQISIVTEITSDGAIQGPLWVTGGIPILRSDGQPCEIRNRVTLCNCGRSQIKPLCDGSHRDHPTKV